MPKIETGHLDSIIQGATKLKNILGNPDVEPRGIEYKVGEYSFLDLPEVTVDEIKELDSDLWALIYFIETGDYKEFMSDEAIEKAAADAMDDLEKNLAMEGAIDEAAPVSAEAWESLKGGGK